jgi:MFS family permease
MNGFAGIFGGLIGYATGHITNGLTSWKYIFLIFGSITILWSIIFITFFPDLPSTTRFLTAEEKVVAVERVARNRSGVKNHTFKWYQVRQAARDPKTWMLFVMAV